MVGRRPELNLPAQLLPQDRRDVGDRPPEGVVLAPQRVTVHVAVLTRGAIGAVPVDQRVAPRRLADGAVLERGGTGRDHRADGEDDEGEPGRDRPPRMPCAPTSDCRDRPHPTLARV